MISTNHFQLDSFDRFYIYIFLEITSATSDLHQLAAQ